MANTPVSAAAKKRVVVKHVTTAAKPKTFASAAGVKAKPNLKPSIKPVAKTVTKPVTKSAAKMAINPKAVAVLVADKGMKSKPSKDASAKVGKSAKPKKSKLIRDSFTMPGIEYDLIAAVKKRCVAKGVVVKKSEVIRAAIISFAALSDATAITALQALDVIKTGRKPKG